MKKIGDLTKEEIEILFKKYDSLRKIIQSLGYSANGSGSYNLFKNKCKKEEIEIPDFKNINTNNIYKIKTPLDKLLINNSSYPRQKLKKRIIKESLLEYKCDGCGNKGEWNGKKLSLQLDHKNGINNDNRLENLRFLCPNCHSQTENYAGKNNKVVYKCQCGNEKSKKSKNCIICSKEERKNIRKVERPTLKILLDEIEEYGYTKTGKKYRVSDNTIRKWVKTYKNKL